MCKVLRLALPAVLAVACFVGLSGTNAWANNPCTSPLPVLQLKAVLSSNSCGTAPFRAYWAVGKGIPAINTGFDNGTSVGTLIPTTGGFFLVDDWSNFGVDNCIRSLGACSSHPAVNCDLQLFGSDCPDFL